MRLFCALLLLGFFASTAVGQSGELLPQTAQFATDSVDLGRKQFFRNEQVRIPARHDSVLTIVGENYRTVELKLDEDFGHVSWHAGIVVETQVNQARIERYLPYGTYRIEERDQEGNLLRTTLDFEIVPKKDE